MKIKKSGSIAVCECEMLPLSFLAFLVQADDLSLYRLAEVSVVLSQHHGRRKPCYQIFYLHARIYVYEVERFVPDIDVSFFLKTLGDQYLFLLPLAVSFDPCLKLRAFQSKLGQYSAKE